MILTRFISTIRIVLTLIITTGLLITACGGESPPSGDTTAKNTGSSHQPGKLYLTIGTASAAGAFYPLGGGMAELITRYIDNVEATAKTTPGSSAENIPQLADGLIDLGLVTADQADEGYRGTERYNNIAYDGLRAIAAGHGTIAQLVVRRDSPIQSIEQLQGLRIGSGSPGSLQEMMTHAILNAYDVTDWKPNPLNVADSVDALRDGNIDAAVVPAGIPTAGLIDLNSTVGIRLFSLSQDKIDQILAEYPFYQTTVPAGTYESIDEDIETIASKTLLVAWNSLDDDLVYEITKTILEHTAELAAVHQVGADWNLDEATIGVPIPFHAGAARYYAEKGLTVPWAE